MVGVGVIVEVKAGVGVLVAVGGTVGVGVLVAVGMLVAVAVGVGGRVGVKVGDGAKVGASVGMAVGMEEGVAATSNGSFPLHPLSKNSVISKRHPVLMGRYRGEKRDRFILFNPVAVHYTPSMCRALTYPRYSLVNRLIRFRLKMKEVEQEKCGLRS
jgi:hypothetical protein